MLRGNEKRDIFLDEDDKLRFLDIIHQKKQEQRFYILAFCLMNNHVHLMISEGTDDIAKIVKRIAVSYVIYFNKKYQRVGHLFQDRFRSEAVEDDAYVLSLARYIHRNPIKANLVKSPDEYPWSSYNGYCEEGSDILDKEIILGLFSNNHEESKILFVEYMNIENNDRHLDVIENDEIMDENTATQLYEKLLKNRGVNLENGKESQIPNDIVWEFKELSKLSIRKIANISGLNKNKVNQILK